MSCLVSWIDYLYIFVILRLFCVICPLRGWNTGSKDCIVLVPPLQAKKETSSNSQIKTITSRYEAAFLAKTGHERATEIEPKQPPVWPEGFITFDMIWVIRTVLLVMLTSYLLTLKSPVFRYHALYRNEFKLVLCSFIKNNQAAQS